MRRFNVFVNDVLVKEKGRRLLDGRNDALLPSQCVILLYSNGWLTRFKRRNKIQGLKSHRKSGDAGEDAIVNQLPALRAPLAMYSSNDIFNANGCRLFYYQPTTIADGPERFSGQ